MTPKEKALYLINNIKVHAIVSIDPEEKDEEWDKAENYFALQCAEFTTILLIKHTRSIDGDQPGCSVSENHEEYWREVLVELKKMRS